MPIVGKTTYTYYDAAKYHQLNTQVQYAGTENAHTINYELTADGLNTQKITENYKNNRQVITTYVYDASYKGNVTAITVVDKNNGVEKNLGTTCYEYTDQNGNYNRFPSRISNTADTNDENFALSSQEISVYYTYTPDGQIETETDGLNRTKTNEYYRNGVLKSETGADGSQVSYVYQLKNISQEISGVSASTENQVITTTKNINTDDPAYVTEETYDNLGRLLEQEERKGLGTVTLAEYAYDELGRPITIWDANGNKTQYTYDWKGRVTQVTYPEIKNDTLETPETEGIATAVNVAYDDARLTQTVTDAAGVKTQATFDVLERVVKEANLSERGEDGTYVLRENPITTVYTYDYMGNNTSIETGREESQTGELITAGRKSEYTYNDLAQLLSVKNGLNEVTSYEYDQWGNVNRMLNAGGSSTYMEYDGFGRLLWKSQPTNKERSALTETDKQQYVYNAVGNLIKYKDQKGQTGTIAYKQNTDYIEEQKIGEITTSYTYNGFGAVTAMTDSTGVTSYSYDYKNRLETLTLPDEKSLFYKYDDMGNVDYVTDYFGNKHDYTYNAQNMLIRVSSGGKTVNYAYNGDGTLRQKEQTGSVYTAYSYDENKNLVSMINQVKATSEGGTYEYTKYSYTYNKYGEQTEKKEEYKEGTNALETRVTSYAYDELGRLSKETAEERSTTYTYDANGNRIMAEIEHTSGDKVETALGSIDKIIEHSINYSYDQANRLQKVTESIESGESETSAYEGLLEIAEEYQYDANGNIKTKAKSYNIEAEVEEEEEYALGTDGELNSYVYTYDEENRMRSVNRGDGKRAEYTYDGTGARVGKTFGTTGTSETETTKYYNMGDMVLNEESSEDGKTTNVIGAGIEARLSVEGSSVTRGYFLQKNGHGDVTALLSGTERAATYDYDAFGNPLEEEGEISNPVRYAGEYLDEESGLIYLRARYYDPSTGRFVSEDTHWTPENMIYGDNANQENPMPNMSAITQSLNLYVYCMSDPISGIDPTGEYNRWAAVAYAKLHSIRPDEGELRFNQDCTNFVSWCLLAGDLQESDDWYFNYAIAAWIPGKGRVVYGSYSATWVQANELFQCFINYCNEFPNSPYVAGPPLEIFGKETLQRRILEGGFQVGDLLFWDYGNTGTMDHAAIIVEITDRDIIYAAHDSDKNNGSVRDFYNGDDYAVIYIVRVPDNA